MSINPSEQNMNKADLKSRNLLSNKRPVMMASTLAMGLSSVFVGTSVSTAYAEEQTTPQKTAGDSHVVMDVNRHAILTHLGI